MGSEEELLMYVGTYSEWDEESIYLYHVSKDGQMKLFHGFDAGKNPSYFSLDEAKSRLYAINECTDFDKHENGAVSAFEILERGDLRFLNRSSSFGALPVQILFSGAPECLFVANYNSGNVTAFSIAHDGSIGSILQNTEQTGSGPNEERQDSSHSHQVIFSPDKRFLYVVDLGADELLKITPPDHSWHSGGREVAFRTHSGWGPRQMVFHPFYEIAYLVHELHSQVSVLSFDPEVGDFEEKQSLPTIPESFNEINKCGRIEVSADGRHLYISNRGHNSITVFRIDPQGLLSFVEYADCGGVWPRDFAIDPSGKLLVVGNQTSNDIVSFYVDDQSGTLRETGFVEKIQKPVFILFLRPEDISPR